jgi:hypothetical protein
MTGLGEWTRNEKQQAPCGNDRRKCKGKSKSNDNCGSLGPLKKARGLSG